MADNINTILVDNTSISKIMCLSRSNYLSMSANIDPYYDSTLFLVNDGTDKVTDIYLGANRFTDIIVQDVPPNSTDTPGKFYLVPSKKVVSTIKTEEGVTGDLSYGESQVTGEFTTTCPESDGVRVNAICTLEDTNHNEVEVNLLFDFSEVINSVTNNYSLVPSDTSKPEKWDSEYNKSYYVKVSTDPDIYELNSESDWEVALGNGLYVISFYTYDFSLPRVVNYQGKEMTVKSNTYSPVFVFYKYLYDESITEGYDVWYLYSDNKNPSVVYPVKVLTNKNDEVIKSVDVDSTSGIATLMYETCVNNKTYPGVVNLPVIDNNGRLVSSTLVSQIADQLQVAPLTWQPIVPQ